MWWLDPGKEVLNILFNRILAPYVENLDMNQVNYGIGQGQLTLRGLRLKKGALDKFRLPVDVLEGHLGKFTLRLHWMNLGNQPVEIMIEDVYLLVVPAPQSNADPEEEEQRAQATKAERLENAELLHMRGQAEVATDDKSQQTQGLWASLTAKIINNLQVTVKNIHIRYEDKLSVPGHPFAAGITLAGFTAVSVDENRQPVFIESTAGAIHKLGKLESLAVYFDTDSASMAGLPPAEAIQKFSALISKDKQATDHQFILSPVSGEGRIIMNHKLDKDTPRFDVQLLFDEIGVALDDNQYRDVISLVDMYHVYVRQHQYRKFRPAVEEFESSRPKALLKYAGTSILEGVRERHRKWTWAYFAERRDDRNRYVELFKKKLQNPLTGADLKAFEDLEKKLSYEDIRFYRSIARSQSRKDAASRKKLEAEQPKKQEPAKTQGWGAWLWGSSQQNKTEEEPTFGGPMTDEQRKELYDALDYDEKAALATSFEAPRDALKARVGAKLQRGSFALKTDPRGQARDIVSVVFDVFQATVIQRPDNLEGSFSLGGFSIFDGTTTDTLYPQIVHVNDAKVEEQKGKSDEAADDEPFFFVKFEQNPLDERADTALTVRMRHMEIIYHKGYVEAVYRFFKPPASQLESVEALLSVASQTLEGLRKETRAGLEYALQTHKTVDLQVDMNAPIIIIPEDITTQNCKHLLVDAGHIAVESDLANKDAVREIHLKRNQQYSDEDYSRLESLMYDKFSLKLEAAQFLIGEDLQSLRDALISQRTGKLHFVERINIDLQVQNSIVPTAVNLAKIKVAGTLPTLQVNFSDSKYKSLMRLIDVCIPKFDDPEPPVRPALPAHSTSGAAFQLPSGLFGSAEAEYNVEDDEQQEPESSPQKDTFFEAEDGDSGRPDLRQHIFELNFKVDTLRAIIMKTSSPTEEKLLGDVVLDHFALTFALAKFDMKVEVTLKSLSMDVTQPSCVPIKFISSAASDAESSRDLLAVTYTRVQKESPEYMSVYEGIDQSVDMKISTFIFRAAPEPVLAMYDFIMTTFVPESKPLPPDRQSSQALEIKASADAQSTQSSSGKIRVVAKLASVRVVLVNGEINLATLSLSTADVAILLRGNAMRISGRVGSLALSDDSEAKTALPDLKDILSIEGDNFADFRYQTFDPSEENYNGIKSSVYLSAGSLKLHFLEQPLHDIYLFVCKLAKLKGLYDAARQAAVQSASEIERMQFEVLVKSPIVVFPSNATSSRDHLVLRLGEITAKNSYDDVVNKMTAGLRGIQFVSNMYYDGSPSQLKIIDDIDVIADITQTNGIDRSRESEYPDAQVAVNVSDVKLHLTQVQFKILMGLAQSIPRVLAGAPEGYAQAHSVSSTGPNTPLSPSPPEEALVDLQPELRGESQTWTSVDLVVTISTAKLRLYDEQATSEANIKDHGIARFTLNENTLRFKMLSDGAMEAQVVLKSFTVGNTRPGPTKFREMIPAAQHDRNQFMILYTMSGGQSKSALAVVTIDSPRVIFAVDPIIALAGFFSSPTATVSNNLDTDEFVASREVEAPSGESRLDFRVDLHDVSISVLENDADPESQAIHLAIKQILLSQQGILALTVNRLGMSLIRMGKTEESVSFLDEVDLTLSLDSRTSSSQQMTNVELSMKPIVFRASYRDINLITSIVNKAIELYGSSQSGSSRDTRTGASPSAAAWPSRASEARTAKTTRSKSFSRARVLMTKEQLKGNFDGFRLVLIGDMFEQPMLHLKVKPFVISAKDWSTKLAANTTLAVSINYWNLTNSHWEPLIDPWTFTVAANKDEPSGGMKLGLSARDRLDTNISTTFVELAMTTMRQLGKEAEYISTRGRGKFAPYRIKNRTGCPVVIWSDLDGSASMKDVATVKINHDEIIDWRFDDWKNMRENLSSSSQQHIGIQFVGKPWEHLRSVPVNKEGEYTFSLRPRTEKFANRVLCEVTVQDNTKIVTIRSSYKIENQTLYPLEVTLMDATGRPVSSLEKIAPGQDYSLPIEEVTRSRIKIQPDQGFGYKWSSSLRWEDLITRKNFTIRCPHTDRKEADFRFQASVQADVTDANTRKCPKIRLRLRAPIELENLLPYNIQYRIYDKDSDQNWRSYLRKGGIMPVHSVELGHMVMLNVDIQDSPFKPSDFAIISTDGRSDLSREKRVTIRDGRDRKLDLRLNYVRYPDSGGAFKVQIYSSYLVINKTGMPFGVKTRASRASSPQEAAGDSRPETLAQPIPFLLSHPSDNGHEFVFKVGESTWSKVFNLDAPAAETELVAPAQSGKNREIHVGFSWTEGLGKYKLTKVITLAPRFLIQNNLAETLSFREHGVPPTDRSTIECGQRSSLLWLRAGQEKLLTIAFTGLNTQWSPPINMEDIGSVHFRLKSPGENGKERLIRADVKIDGPMIFVFFTLAAEGWPFVIENQSDFEVSFYQILPHRSEEDKSPRRTTQYTVKPKNSVGYAWDYPALRDKKIELNINGVRRPVDLQEIGDLVPFKFRYQDRSRAVSLDVRADGHKQVLRITNYSAERSIYQPKRQSSTLSRADTSASVADVFEAVTEDIPPSLSFSVDFAGIGVSLINRKLVEVLYLTLDSLKFDYTNSDVAQTINLTIGSLQVDNQLHEAIFPVIIQPTPIPKDNRNRVAALPTVQGSVIWLKDDQHGVLFIKYFSILLQALNVEVDEDFLFTMLDLTKIKGLSWEEESEDALIVHPDTIPEPQATAVGQDLYFEVLELQPIKLYLSFMRTERVSSDDKLSIRNPLAVVINAFTMAVGNVNDAPVELNALAIKDMRLTVPELQERITYHYRQDVLRQLYRIIGSADFFGNPVGLFNNVSSGVADIFYEPFNGVVMHGNKELGIGIAKGAASFVKKTVFGFSDSMTKFTSSVGKGLSAATFDPEYQARRRMQQRRNKPRHLVYGLSSGGEAFAESIASAAEGVVMQPLQGAQSEGAVGFFKGLGKGVVGVVAKPIVGVFDAASNVSEGLRNTTTVFDSPERDRVRLPRHISADGVLSSYSGREAMGQYWMKDLENGAFRNESYVAHINTPGGDNVVLLTSSRVISMWTKKLRLGWDLPFTMIQGVTVEDTGIRFSHKAGKDNDKFVYIPDKSSQSWFFGQVASVVKAYNARRRMDS